MKKKFETSNIYFYLLYKCGIALLGILLIQLFFYICNTKFFVIDGMGEALRLIWGNAVIGSVTVATFLCPFIIVNVLPGSLRWRKWYHFISEILYALPIWFVITMTAGDAVYYHHTFRKLSIDLFAYLGVGGQMGSLVPLFIRDYWYVGIGYAISLGAWIWLNLKIKLTKRNYHNKHFANDLVGGLICLVLMVILMRGSVTKESIQLNDSCKYGNPQNSALVVNSGYSILRTALEEPLQPMNYMSNEEAQKLFNPEFSSLRHQQLLMADSIQRDSIMRDTTIGKRNVVIIMVESLSQEYMGCYNEGEIESHTPFLDQLALKSKVYQGRSNGKKSIESIPAVCASLPTWMYAPIDLTPYGKNKIVGLPEILKKYGYKSMVFHGGYNGTMDFDKFCYGIGVDEYLGMDEYLAAGGSMDNYDKVWGIFDEPFLQYMAQHLGEQQEPFFSLCFTTTSHHPFPIPEQYKGVFPKGEHPILECVSYTDNAIQKFFEVAQKSEWFDNTLFIIIADHPGYVIKKEFTQKKGLYRIPMIIYDPQDETHFVSNQIVQQTDLMPTIIDFLHLDETCVCFGNSLYQHKGSGYQVVFGNGFYMLDCNSNPTIIAGRTEVGEQSHLQLLKAIVQQYSDRMINNKMTTK